MCCEGCVVGGVVVVVVVSRLLVRTLLVVRHRTWSYFGEGRIEFV